MTSSEPDYARAAEAALSLLRRSDCRALPVDLNAAGIIPPDMRVCAYSEAARLGDCSVAEVSAFLGSDSGACVRLGKNFILYANDVTGGIGAFRFTCAHELGHYYLGHFAEEREAYAKNEKEANCFARNLLVPHVLIARACPGVYLSEEKASRISALFGVSKSAAKVRLDFCATDASCLKNADLGFLSDFVFRSGVLCQSCGLVSGDGKYCGHCAAELSGAIPAVCADPRGNDENVSRCLMCGGVLDGEKVCRLCGFPSLNVCANPDCAARAEPDAVFCSCCGSPTIAGELRNFI